MTAIVQKYIEVRLPRGLESGAELQETDFRRYRESLLKHRKRDRTWKIMHLAKTGICVLSRALITEGRRFPAASNCHLRAHIAKAT